MRKINCTYKELYKVIKGKRIIIYGAGDYFNLYIREMCSNEFLGNISYFVDNGKHGSAVVINGRCVDIKSVEALENEKHCIIVLASSNFMQEMYQVLEKMELDDSVECIAFPLMMAASRGNVMPEIENKIFNGERQIDRIIHCFWFSGDKKPMAYQKCIDSWKRNCPEYEIREWNKENYDYTRHPFVKKAVELKKWAFASDYARLDVMYQYGGIYMDMDVEVLKSLDSLLGNRAFFSFDTNNDIDMGVFGSAKENTLICKMMHLYDGIEFDGTMKEMNLYCQPRHIRSVLKKIGLCLNGDMQYINGMAFLPRQYLMPKDYFVYQLLENNDKALAIHHFNAGWKASDYRSQRMENNCRLKEIFEGNS